MWGWPPQENAEPLHTFWVIPSHLTFPFGERIADSYSIHPVLGASFRTLGHCYAIWTQRPGPPYPFLTLGYDVWYFLW